MNLKILSNQLTKIFNTLGNQWLVENFETDPFDMRVFVRKGDAGDLQDYEIDVYTDKLVPQIFKYKDKKGGYSGAHINVVKHHFKDLAKYVQPNMGEFRYTFGLNFMDMNPNSKL